jgi:mannose PTS system EIIA component
MIGLVLVTHGRLADEFRSALEHVVGPQSDLETICIGPDDDMERRRADIIEAVDKVESGGGVVLLTDMFGGTPSNLAMQACRGGKRIVLYGANLPLLIKLAKARRLALDEAVACALTAGRKYINTADGFGPRNGTPVAI